MALLNEYLTCHKWRDWNFVVSCQGGTNIQTHTQTSQPIDLTRPRAVAVKSNYFSIAGHVELVAITTELSAVSKGY